MAKKSKVYKFWCDKKVAPPDPSWVWIKKSGNYYVEVSNVPEQNPVVEISLSNEEQFLDIVLYYKRLRMLFGNDPHWSPLFERLTFSSHDDIPEKYEKICKGLFTYKEREV